MAKFKIPGVYVEEIPKSSTIKSISDTAIFLGYTEKSQNDLGENNCNIPIKINSLEDFETFFGTAQIEEHLEITDDSTAVLEKISIRFNSPKSLHNLYYSIKSFFDQGGKSCKIISVGAFKNCGDYLTLNDFLLALELLNNETGNLLISIPESQNLEGEDFSILQQNLLEFCKKNLGFAILEVPRTSKENFKTEIDFYRSSLNSSSLSYGAAFFPNLVTDYSYHYDEEKIKIKKSDDEFSLLSLKQINQILYNKYQNVIRQFFVTIPPSGVVAGSMIKNDDTKGIWKASANIPLLHITRPEFPVNDSEQEFLNEDLSDKNINCIRTFFGRGILIWGERTLSNLSSEFKYIPVRRFTSLIQNDLKHALESFTFEENSSSTWIFIKNITEKYLLQYWNSGAFQGAKPENSFFVKCGLNQTMTQQDLDTGNLIVEIGVAITRPSEFEIFRIIQKTSV